MPFGDPIRGTTVTMNDVAALIESIGSASFPFTWSTYSPNPQGFISTPANIVGTYIQWGKLVICNFSSNPGTSNSTSFTITAPVTAATRTNAYWAVRLHTVIDNGAYSTSPANASISSGQSVITLQFNQNGTTTWTSTGSRQGNFTGLIYEAA